jgi:hypothetical protein
MEGWARRVERCFASSGWRKSLRTVGSEAKSLVVGSRDAFSESSDTNTSLQKEGREGREIR